MAKREAKKVVQEGKWKAYNKLYSKLEEGEKIIYKLAKTREIKTRDLNNAHFEDLEKAGDLNNAHFGGKRNNRHFEDLEKTVLDFKLFFFRTLLDKDGNFIPLRLTYPFSLCPA